MKNKLLITLSIILLVSCKKPHANTQQPYVYTSNDTVQVNITANATLSKNINGYWVVTGNSLMSPSLPIVMTGSFSYQVYDNGQFKFTQTDESEILGNTITDILPSNITNPSLQEIVYEPFSYYSTSSVFYDLHIQ